jgi:fermentation-respiration switch protein FrsA (DUF1100 family)
MENVERAHSFLLESLGGKGVKVGAIASSFGATALLMQPRIANQLLGIALKSPAPFLAEAYLKEIGIGEFRKWVVAGNSTANGYSSEVLKDAFKHNVFLSASEISVPCLVTHGTADEIVPYVQSELLVACLRGAARLEPIADGDHGYSKEGQWDQMATIFVQWLSGLMN